MKVITPDIIPVGGMNLGEMVGQKPYATQKPSTGNSSPAFDPYVLFELFYDAKSVTESGGLVSAIANLGTAGSSLDQEQGTGGNQATYNPANATYGNHPTIDPGGNDFYGTAGDYFDFSFDSNWSLFFVGERTGTYWSLFESNSHTSYNFEQLTATTAYIRDPAGAFVTVNTANLNTDIYIFNCNGNDLTVYRGSDGSTYSISGLSSLSTSAQLNALFRRYAGGAGVYAEGEMAKAGLGTNLLTLDQLNDLGNWLSSETSLTWTAQS